jgi:hypothetical protein
MDMGSQAMPMQPMGASALAQEASVGWTARIGLLARQLIAVTMAQLLITIPRMAAHVHVPTATLGRIAMFRLAVVRLVLAMAMEQLLTLMRLMVAFAHAQTNSREVIAPSPLHVAL